MGGRQHLGPMFLSLLLVSLFSSLPFEPTVSAFLDSHEPIWVQGDSGFTAQNGVVSGSGSADDPYIISGWDISVMESTVFFDQGFRAGILVEDTRAHFIIREVTVHDGPVSSANLVFKNVINGRVETSHVSRGNIGILFWETLDSVVAGNDISGFGVGVELDSSSGVLIEGNLIGDSAWPIFAALSTYNWFLGNAIEGREMLTASQGVAIYFNSSFNVLEGNIIRGGSFGVSVQSDSHFNMVRDNQIMHVDRSGVAVGTGSRGNTVEDNTIVDSGRGVTVFQAFETRVESNWISAFIRDFPPGSERFSGKGVWVLDSSNTRITGNTVTAPVGISICNSWATFIAPPPNDLREADRPIERCSPAPGGGATVASLTV